MVTRVRSRLQRLRSAVVAYADEVTQKIADLAVAPFFWGVKCVADAIDDATDDGHFQHQCGDEECTEAHGAAA